MATPKNRIMACSTTTSATSLSLPPEILENIFSFCTSDIPTLHQLSLVSTTCLSLARRLLFAQVTLIGPPTSYAFIGRSRVSALNTRLLVPSQFQLPAHTPCARFLSIIKDSEPKRSRLGDLAPFVRHLCLSEGTGMSSWVTTDPSLPHLLRSLSNLLSFRLSSTGASPILWDGIPFTLQETIAKYVLSQLTLTEVSLHRVVFGSLKQVNNLLGHCRTLRTLKIDHSGVHADEDPSVETDGGVEKATLDTLILGPLVSGLFVGSFLSPSCPLRVDTIRHLSLSSPCNFPEFAGLLRASPFLDTLDLTLTNRCKQFFAKSEFIGIRYLCNPISVDVHHYWTLPPSEQLNLSKSASLSNFRIKFDMLQDMDGLIEWLAAVLQTAVDPLFPTCPNTMKSLSITFVLFVRLSDERLVDPTLLSKWRSVDAVLCGDGHKDEHRTHPYSNLKRVHLEFLLLKPINLRCAPRFLDELALSSPGLRERGILSVDAIDEGR